MGTRLVAADAFDTPTLAALFTDAYAGYVLPVHVDAAAFAAMVELSDVDLARSRIALRDEQPVGLALLARRGDECWIAGMGVAPAARRTGLGKAVMDAVIDEAGSVGAGCVRLEVIEQNVAARRLYEQLGFRRVRDLEVWSLERVDGPPVGAREIDADDARAWIAAHRPSPEPWQRADATLDRMLTAGRSFDALSVERDAGRVGAAVFTSPGGTASVLQLAAVDEGAAADLLAAIAGRGDGLRLVNAPSGEPASEALARLGGRVDVRQLELELRLRAPRG